MRDKHHLPPIPLLLITDPFSLLLPPGIPHFDDKYVVEKYGTELGLPLTVLRPVCFMDNFSEARILGAAVWVRVRGLGWVKAYRMDRCLSLSLPCLLHGRSAATG